MTEGILVLSDADIRAALPTGRAIESQKVAYVAASEAGRVYGSGAAHAGLTDDTLVFAATGSLRGVTGVVCKFGMQVPGNAARGLPSVHAFVTLLDAETGQPLACLNGTTITTIRTAAGLAAAADALANPAAVTLGVLGAGVQARETIRCVAEVRALRAVYVCSRDPEHVRALIADVQPELHATLHAAASAREVSERADIVACCTTSRDPVVFGEFLNAGATVLTMGSYHPAGREIDLAATRRAATTVVDDVAKAFANCGPVIDAVAAGAVSEAALVAVGDILAGRRTGRASLEDILVFHSMGLAAQDAAAAWAVYQSALETGAGRRVAF